MVWPQDAKIKRMQYEIYKYNHRDRMIFDEPPPKRLDAQPSIDKSELISHINTRLTNEETIIEKNLKRKTELLELKDFLPMNQTDQIDNLLKKEIEEGYNALNKIKIKKNELLDGTL